MLQDPIAALFTLGAVGLLTVFSRWLSERNGWMPSAEWAGRTIGPRALPWGNVLGENVPTLPCRNCGRVSLNYSRTCARCATRLWVFGAVRRLWEADPKGWLSAAGAAGIYFLSLEALKYAADISDSTFWFSTVPLLFTFPLLLISYFIIRDAQGALFLKDFEALVGDSHAVIAGCEPLAALLDSELVVLSQRDLDFRLIPRSRILEMKAASSHGDNWLSVRVRGKIYPLILRFGLDRDAMERAEGDLGAFVGPAQRER